MADLASLVTARDYLADHADEPLTLTSASAIAAYSPHHFQRLFTQTFKESPHAFLQRLRFERARDLLLNTETDVQEICILVGYTSPATFVRQFKTKTGITPQQFRREARRCFHVGRWRTPQFVPMCMVNRFGFSENES